MATASPRSASPALHPLVVPHASHGLQISPNLDALLEHDELTRRSSSSPPPRVLHSTTALLEFPISLPPPPPRTAKSSLRMGQREQGPFPTTRSREGQRKRIGSDGWPDALPMTLPLDDSAAGQPASPASSRPVTPNPYLNPAPMLSPTKTAQPHSDTDQVATPIQPEKTLPAKRDTQGRTGASDPTHRPSKVEKILWMGRDSLHLFSSSANGLKRHDSDRPSDRVECGDLDAVQDGQMRQLSVTSLSGPASRFGGSTTATVLSSSAGTSYPQRARPTQSSETASTYSCPIDSESTALPPHRLPCVSLPCISMSHRSSTPHPSIDSLTGRNYLSFIEFLSPPMSDESGCCNVQDSPREITPSRHQPRSISIPPSSIYSTSCHTISSSSLASMRFAPPSPTFPPHHHLSPISTHSDTSSHSVALSSMMFAPPSPSIEHDPTSRLEPLSEPPSPYSPLEFAPPPGFAQDIIDAPLSPAPELAAERGRRLKSKKRSVSLSPDLAHHPLSPLPPTTNQLGASERADRIRRNRKLARVFGRAPGAEEPVTDSDEPRVPRKLHSPSLAALLMKQKNHRHAVSVSVSLKPPGAKTEPSTPWQTDDIWCSGGRRHSIPLAASSFRLYVDDKDEAAANDPFSSRDLMDSLEVASTRSFIDLSDEELCEDDLSTLNFLAPPLDKRRYLHQSNSTPSLVESFDPEAQAEAERRRKRERLARLHRFLGSRVPPEAVNGSVFGPPLPPLGVRMESNRERWLRANNNASVDVFDRGKEELDEREKALNVRRAQKMERVFGTPPPQVLFHTRPNRLTAPVSQPTTPTGFNPYVLTLDVSSYARNRNQSAYMGKAPRRQGPSESSRCLLSHKEDTPQYSPSSFAQSFAEPLHEMLSESQEGLARSTAYLNYQHSLNSLVDIIDRDDRRSLAELHRCLHEEVDESLQEETIPTHSRRASNATSFKSERRYSLPSNASMTSLSSEFYASTKASRFQIRRRTAAKLTNFFGVDYRELIHDVLESIEKGVEDERKQGTLWPQEVEALMHRVRSLRILKGSFS